MAKKTPQTPQQAATQAGAGVFGRVRQMFSRKNPAKNAAQDAAGGAAMASQMRGQNALGGAKNAKKDVFTATATGADRTIGRAHGMLSRVNQITVFGGMAAGALGALGKLPLVGNMFSSASEMAQKPEKIMSETTVRDVGQVASKTLGRARDVLATRKGEDAALVGRLTKAQERVVGFEGKLMSGTKQAAHRLTDPLGNALESRGSGLLGKLSARAGRGAEKHTSAAQDVLGNLMAQGADNAALKDVHGSLEAAQKALGGGAGKGLDAEAYAEAMAKAKESLSGIAKGTVDKKTLGGLKKGLQKAGEAGSLASQRSGMAEKMSNLPGAVKNAPDALAGANLKNVALKGAVVTGTALQITGTARGIGEKVSTLKALYCDLTGEEKISTRKLLFSKKVPAVVKEARGHIMKEYGPRVVLNFANTIATYTFMKNTNAKSMIGSFGLMAASSLHAAKVQSYGILPMYEAMNKSPQIEDVQYAGFIAAASKDAAAAGGIESPMVQQLAMDYAKEGARPAAILQEIESGRFDERVVQKAQQMRENLHQATGQSAGQASPSAMGGRDVVGAHTQRLREETRGNAQAR